MLLLYENATGHIVGINDNPVATFENMYPDVSEEFKQIYGGLVVEHNPDYDRNRNWYKVENGEVIKLDAPWAREQIQLPDPRDQQISDLQNAIADLQIATAAILGGAA